jgi:FMN phosphatase YigB (HAD superfamily)
MTRRNEAFIFDLDGTLADCEHRRHWIATKPKNWKAFFAGIPNDPVIEWVATVARRTFERGEIDVVIVTARDEYLCRKNTEAWLKDNGIRFDAIYFRPDKDYRGDTLVKHEIYQQVKADGFKPVLVFDDRPKVIRMWKEQGLIVVDCGAGVEF